MNKMINFLKRLQKEPKAMAIFNNSRKALTPVRISICSVVITMIYGGVSLLHVKCCVDT